MTEPPASPAERRRRSRVGTWLAETLHERWPASAGWGAVIGVIASIPAGFAYWVTLYTASTFVLVVTTGEPLDLVEGFGYVAIVAGIGLIGAISVIAVGTALLVRYRGLNAPTVVLAAYLVTIVIFLLVEVFTPLF